MDFAHRKVIVTGGVGGIGLQVSRRWLLSGASVLVVGSQQESVDAGLQSLGRGANLYGLACDLAGEDGAAKMATEAKRVFGSPADTLLHLVGGFGSAKVESDDASQVWRKMISLNLDSAFYCYRAAIAGFRESGSGCIVGMASRTALQPPAKLAAYAASKAGLLALTRSLAAETLREEIRINAIITSTVDTPANRTAMGDAKASDWVSADDIADATLFLCSEQAKSISGAALEVYGKT